MLTFPIDKCKISDTFFGVVFEGWDDKFLILAGEALREISNCRFWFILVIRSLLASILFLSFRSFYLWRPWELSLLCRDMTFSILHLGDLFLFFVIFLCQPLKSYLTFQIGDILIFFVDLLLKTLLFFDQALWFWSFSSKKLFRYIWGVFRDFILV